MSIENWFLSYLGVLVLFFFLYLKQTDVLARKAALAYRYLCGFLLVQLRPEIPLERGYVYSAEYAGLLVV